MLFVDPDSVEAEERIPGVSVPIRAELRAGDERLGLLLASLPATRTWERADQTLLDLYASEIGVAIRNAELFNQVQDQNRQLRQLSEVKDDFLRGVSHNLQTPLTSIRSNADALAATDKDPRLTIISDQADRLTRMVQQLLLVGRLESQPPDRPPTSWPSGRACSAPGMRLAVADRAAPPPRRRARLAGRRRRRPARPGPLGPPGQRRQIRTRARSPSRSAPTRPNDGLWTTVSDDGRGFEEADRAWLFGRFERGAAGRTSGNGSGLGLYVSRALMRGMGGDLVLDDVGGRTRRDVPPDAAGRAGQRGLGTEVAGVGRHRL